MRLCSQLSKPQLAATDTCVLASAGSFRWTCVSHDLARERLLQARLLESVWFGEFSAGWTLRSKSSTFDS